MVSPDKDFFEGYSLIATPEKPLRVIGERESPKEDAIFEGYWLIATPHRPLSWVDVEKSEVMVDMVEEYDILIGFKEAEKVEEITAITPKEEVQNIPLKERQIFNIHESRKT